MRLDEHLAPRGERFAQSAVLAPTREAGPQAVWTRLELHPIDPNRTRTYAPQTHARLASLQAWLPALPRRFWTAPPLARPAYGGDASRVSTHQLPERRRRALPSTVHCKPPRPGDLIRQARETPTSRPSGLCGFPARPCRTKPLDVLRGNDTGVDLLAAEGGRPSRPAGILVIHPMSNRR